ncbi:MAG TPA: hypothetical protein VKZ89_06895 [Thermobifida alba]|nr:hypothetical protein [Thermobifida alba]
MNDTTEPERTHMEKHELISTRDEFRTEAQKIRHSSVGLSGEELRSAQDQHRRLLVRIAQLNESIRNH